MTKLEQARYNALLHTMKLYRSRCRDLESALYDSTTMTDKAVRRFLRLPDARLVEYALSLCNLTTEERLVVDECFRRGVRREDLAERMDRGRNCVQILCRSALDKMRECWSGCRWIAILANKP